MIDLPARRAYWFFIEIWPQDIYILTGILVFLAVILFAVTSMFGRVWCGYFCFQTVWTDLFIWVERIVQGDRFARQKLDDSPLSFEKIWKKGLTHFIWILIGLFTAGTFVLYFNDAPSLLTGFLHLQASPMVLGFMIALTLSTYVMAGFAREQVCTFMCPYARFQSAMFDKETLIIGYDPIRGEPRGKHKKGDSWEGKGHCVNCTACVQVCPMGIDIREGLQMECIACGLCVDACDEIMDKVELPRGLVRYDTERNFDLLAKGQPEEKFHIWRPRTLYYGAVLSLIGISMLYALLTISPLELHVLHDRNPLFVQLSDGNVRNGYEIKILNKTHEHSHYALSVSGLEGAVLSVKGAGEVSAEDLYVPADSVGAYHVFVSAPKQEEERKNVSFALKSRDGKMEDTYESIFISKRPRG